MFDIKINNDILKSAKGGDAHESRFKGDYAVKFSSCKVFCHRLPPFSLKIILETI